MPFLGVLPARLDVFQPQPVTDVGVNDVQAWRLNPAHRHIYNKLEIALAQGLNAAPCGVSPESCGFAADTPVFVKPIINLAGMSVGARKARADELCTEPGHFWCEWLEGEQTSTDCLMQDGRVRWFAHTRAARERNRERPLYWQVGVDLPDLEPRVRRFLEQHLATYTGLCNLEMINGRVIEVHLRGSNGFFDFYGAAFMQSWVSLVDHNRWQNPGKIAGGVVYSVFMPAAPDNWPDLKKRLEREFPETSIQTDEQVLDRIAVIRGPCLDQARQIEARIRLTVRDALSVDN